MMHRCCISIREDKMHKTVFVFAALVIALFAPTAPAAAITLEEAKALCSGQFRGRSAADNAARTGVTQQESIRRCIAEKMGKK